MGKLRYRIIPEGVIGNAIIPLNLVLIDAKDVAEQGVGYRAAFEAVAKDLADPTMMNIIDLDCVTTTSDGLMAEGAIVAMAASDRNRIHPEFGYLEMVEVPYSEQRIQEEPHLKQWNMYPGKRLMMGITEKLLPIHNATMTGRACNNNAGTELWSIETMNELLMPVLGQIELVRGGNALIGMTGEEISVGIGMVVGEEFGRIMPGRPFHVGQTAHRSGIKAKGLKAQIPIITCDKEVLAGYVIKALNDDCIPGRDIGPAPAIITVAKYLGKPIAMDLIEEAAFEELASVGFTKEWFEKPVERKTEEQILAEADSLIPGGKDYQVYKADEISEVRYADC